MSSISGHPDFYPTAHFCGHSLALVSGHCSHDLRDVGFQFGDAFGSLFERFVLDIAPEVEVGGCEDRRPRWPRDGGSSGDNPITKALLEPPDGSRGCMSGGGILL